jgi:hypothetical protein
MGASYTIITSTLEPEMASKSPLGSTDNGASHIEVHHTGGTVVQLVIICYLENIRV